MASTWQTTVTTIDRRGSDPVETSVTALELDDLVSLVQFMVERARLLRVEIPSGPMKLSIETWAEMLSRNYGGGEPEQPYIYPIKIDIRHGAVVIQSESNP